MRMQSDKEDIISLLFDKNFYCWLAFCRRKKKKKPTKLPMIFHFAALERLLNPMPMTPPTAKQHTFAMELDLQVQKHQFHNKIDEKCAISISSMICILMIFHKSAPLIFILSIRYLKIFGNNSN